VFLGHGDIGHNIFQRKKASRKISPPPEKIALSWQISLHFHASVGIVKNSLVNKVYFVPQPCPRRLD
jgi:hypothetical protein